MDSCDSSVLLSEKIEVKEEELEERDSEVITLDNTAGSTNSQVWLPKIKVEYEEAGSFHEFPAVSNVELGIKMETENDIVYYESNNEIIHYQSEYQESDEEKISSLIGGEEEELQTSPLIGGDEEELQTSPLIGGDEEELQTSPLIGGDEEELQTSPLIGEEENNSSVIGSNNQDDSQFVTVGIEEEISVTKNLQEISSDTINKTKFINNMKPFKCNKCFQQFQTSYDLEFHVSLHIKKIQLKKKISLSSCIYCNQECNTVSVLSIHMRMHKNKLPMYCCSFCNYTDTILNKLTAHISYCKTNHKVFRHCKICHKKFDDLDSLKDHENIHTGLKPHICHMCGLAFKLLDTLDLHLKAVHISSLSSENIEETSTIQKPLIEKVQIPTKTCSRTETVISNYKLSAPYVCSITKCNSRFNTLKQLNIHLQNSHPTTPNIPFYCEMCHKAFATNEGLTNHKNIHTDSTNCIICKQHFNSYKDLKQHMESHNNFNEYRCDPCDKVFSYIGDLNRHMNNHPSPKSTSLVCTICSKVFACQANLRKHINNVHNKNKKPKLDLQPSPSVDFSTLDQLASVTSQQKLQSSTLNVSVQGQQENLVEKQRLLSEVCAAATSNSEPGDTSEEKPCFVILDAGVVSKHIMTHTSSK